MLARASAKTFVSRVQKRICVNCFTAVLFGSNGNPYTACTQMYDYMHAIQRCLSGKRNKKFRRAANAAWICSPALCLGADDTSDWRKRRWHGWDDACYTPILQLGCQYCSLVRRGCIPRRMVSRVFMSPGLPFHPPSPHFNVTLCYR